MRKTLISLFVIIFIFFAMAFPKNLTIASTESLLLWYSKVLPSLFPFSVCINILIHTGFPQMLSEKCSVIMKTFFHVNGYGAFPFIIGIMAGFPVGAKAVSDLYKKDRLTLSECQSLLSFCNNPGPIFIVSTVGYSFLKDEKLGYVILIATMLSSFFTGILWGAIFKTEYAQPKKVFSLNKKNTPPIGEILSSSIYSAANTLVLIGGCMVIFGMVKEIFYILKILNNETFLSFLGTGLIEMTAGASLISKHEINIISKVSLLAFILNFGGASIQFQVFSTISDIPINKGIYILSQTVKAFFASFFSAAILLLF